MTQVDFTATELLTSHRYEEPLLAAGVRCHGGFDDDGTYVSPRTLHRLPAIRAWQAQHAARFGTDLLDVPLATWPEHYPDVAQGRVLIDAGVPEPIISTLTRSCTVEGFGAMLRFSVVPELQRCFDEDVRGTAMAHLDGGLYEAHARDEAGHAEEAGHDRMWFAARDIAFENPVTEDETATMLGRMGITGAGGAPPSRARMREAAAVRRLLPADVDLDLELLIERMIRLLLIEISAFHAFAWAEELLGDPDLVAGDGEGARLVSYIRSDETPHVAYLKTVLTEMRDRTFVGMSGRHHAGTDLVGRLWSRALDESLGERRIQALDTTLAEVTHAIGPRRDRAELLERFHAAGSVRPGADGDWVATGTAAA
ncbi:hypothetical protein BH24ACT3_BH24ACT3_12570 [soil metagenome]